MKKFLVETHMHTQETSYCGKVPARQGVRIYKELGYDAVCITDHFYIHFFEDLGSMPWEEKIDIFLEGYRIAKDEGEKLGVKVILGMEYTFQGTNDDILVYGFDESLLYNHENLHLANEDELKEIADKRNLVLIQAHPFRKMITRTYDELVNGYEGFNGNPRHNSMNDKAYRHALEFGGIMISGSDFHQVQDAGNGGVYLPVLPDNSIEFADILRKIRTPEMVRINL
ncbi:MAG: PHP domain-containing protein [Clostridiaceae bacterium]|nr:PHP domain-containing protein [Clostridiaceae bacterium]